MRFCVKAGRFLNIGLAKAKAAQLIEILLKLWYGQVQYLKSRSCNFLKVKNVKKNSITEGMCCGDVQTNKSPSPCEKKHVSLVQNPTNVILLGF